MTGQQVISRSKFYVISTALSVALTGALTAAVAIILLNSFASRSVTCLLTAALGLLVLIPILHRVIAHSIDLAEPGIWFALFYFTHFGIRAVYDLMFGSPILGFGPEVSNFGLINAALGVSIIGLLVFWMGYHARLGKAIAYSLPTLPRKWSRVRAFPIALICFVVGWGLRILLMASQAGGIGAWLRANKYVELAQAQGTMYISIISGLATVGLLITFVLARRNKNRRYLFLFTLFLIPELAFRFVSGSRAQFIFFLLALLVASYMTSERGYKVSMRYIRWAVALVLLLVFLFPLFSIIRGGIASSGILARTSNFWKDPTALFELVWARQHGLDSLAVVIGRVPDEEPYTLGSELSFILVSWIPRALWPQKPIISVGKIFYEKFYPPIFHEGTAVAVTLPGEFYWDFGLAGVIMGMLFVGVLWRFFFEYLVRPKGNLSNILIVSTMFPAFFTAVEQTIVCLLTMHLFQFLVVAFIALLIRGGTAKREVPR